VLTVCTESGFAVAGMHVDREDSAGATGPDDPAGTRTASVTLSLTGRGALATLSSELSELPGVLAVGVPAEEE
ncbi:MAG TPA: hypothetical protein VK935_14585, partial [Actinomycetospora sp.]|nr:hypothetical protein [Actinomycetospora sp.]